MSQDFPSVIARLRAAGEPTRLRILALLRRGDLAVNELVQVLGQSQPRLSHQLKVLSSAGLVTRLPEGSWVFYRAAKSGPAAELIDLALQQARVDQGELARDARQLEAIQADRAASAAAYFDQIAESWDTLRALHYPEQAIETALLDLAGPGPFRQVIDIGTGTGRMLALFADRARAAEGIDLSHQMLTVARGNLARTGHIHVQVRQGDACATPFESGCADLVIIHQVLHFIEAPERVLAEADRLLEPGGRLLVVDFAPHQLEFLREDHGHRRLGISQAAMASWAETTSLAPRIEHVFDPPATTPNGLAVQIWAADKPGATQRQREEVAA